MGGLTSASRVALQPIVERAKVLYFYNNEYEGGVCDKNVVITGSSPDQYQAVVPWMIKNVGKKVYTITADYNFGQTLGLWVKKLVNESGGTLVGEEYIPLSVSQFSQTISNIEAAKPDWVFTAMVGSNQVSYFQQASAAGLNLPMASPINGTLLYEHKQLPPPVMATKAVEAAGTPEREAVINAIETKDICVDSLEGKLCFDKPTHHVSHPIHIMKVEKDHSVTTVADLGVMPPVWLHEKGCDLAKNPQSTQFTPN
jgi:urea transport system substrate-binding protein